MWRAGLIVVLAACGSPAVDPNVSFTFDVPAGSTGVTLLVSGPAGASDFLGLEELTDPSGKAVVRDFVGVAQPGRRLSGQNGQGLVPVRLPLADDFATQPLPSGTWTAKLGGVTGNPKDPKGSVQRLTTKLTAEVKVQTATAETLDLDVYVPRGLALQGATLEQRWAIAFALFDRLYGWKRGDVRLHDVDARFATISGQTDVDAANRLATGTSGAQVVLTNSLEPDGSPISGLSCVPGAAGKAGTVCSAVLVALRADALPWHDAATLVHELGHFAGLGHSTELSGQTDALSDTPACTDLAKEKLSSCPDHDNLMFPSVNSATSVDAISVSAAQRALVRSSALPR